MEKFKLRLVVVHKGSKSTIGGASFNELRGEGGDRGKRA